MQLRADREQVYLVTSTSVEPAAPFGSAVSAALIRVLPFAWPTAVPLEGSIATTSGLKEVQVTLPAMSSS